MKALDLFCGAGGASRGLQNAGFHVTGIDIKKQPHYGGDVFIQGDALKPPVDISDFDFIWASPPCQAHTAMKTMYNAKKHKDLIPDTRKLLKSIGKPYVMENVMGAPLRPDLILCGTMFDLGTGDAELRRHRIFEMNWTAPLTSPCRHYARGRVCGVYGGHGRDRRRSRPATVTVCGDGNGRDYRRNLIRPATVGVWGKSGGASLRDGTQQFSTKERAEAMGIDWMTGAELSQAIPPAYSEFIGRAAIRQMEEK